MQNIPSRMSSDSVVSIARWRAPFAALGLLSAALALPTASLGAETSAARSAGGIIEGRVSNPATGEYLENVRVAIEGTSLETYTDATGQYRLTDVPLGAARVKASRTGATSVTQTVDVGAGQPARQDFNLTAQGGETVKLAEFVVQTSKEMDGAAIAINTKRVAPNLINVVSADEFGPIADDNVGEVMKTIPGVNIGLGTGGDPFTISLNGVPANNVPVTMGGFNLAKASSGTSRTVGLENVAVNNLSRIEVIYTPTPETTGSALAGTVNMVPRSAFERSRPTYTLSAAMNMRDNDRSFHATPGPRKNPERKVNPGMDFSAVVPVNDRFGFTLSASASILYTPDEFTQMTWTGVSAATNGTTFPNTTPDQPYLSSYIVRDYTKRTKHNSFGATIDYKLSRNDRVSLSFQYGYSDFDGIQHTLTFLTNGVAAGGFALDHTRGAANAGEIRVANLGQKTGGFYYMPNITYRHDGPVWKAELGLGMSRANRILKDIERGYFNNAQARKTGVTVSFANIDTQRPGTITVTDNTGAAVNPYSISTYSLNTATSNALDAWDLQQNAFGNLRREFHGEVPFTVKVGYDLQRMEKDIRRNSPTFTYVGANANASQVLDESFSTRNGPYGFPAIQWLSNEKLYDLYTTNPALFTINEAARYTGNVNTSKHAEELISALYIRGDTQFLNGKLKLTGGLRGEQTNEKGEGALIDATRNFQRAANGSFVVGANNRPVAITTNALEAAKLTSIDRGLHTEKEYLRLFPSINGSYELRENLIARMGYYWSVGRPDLSQYAGGLTLPDTSASPSPSNVIMINNVAIKAWSARTVKASLEYYFENVGLVSISGFSREIKNFFGTTNLRATPDFLNQYGLDQGTYGSYDVQTQYNISTPVRMTGLDFSYKQALTFLPAWASGVQVFANASAQRATGDDNANFSGYVPRTLNAGVSLTRTHYVVRAKWNYQSRARLTAVTGAGIEPGTFNWQSQRSLIDLSGDYFFAKHWALFANLSNITDAAVGLEIEGPHTPKIAQFRQLERFGSLWTFGVRATY